MSTLAAQTRPPRSKRKAAHAAHVSNWPTAAPLVRNSPRGWTPRSLTTIRSAGRRAVGGGCCRRSRPLRPSCRYDHSGSVSAFLAAALPRADDLDGSSGVERLAMAMATSQQPKRRCVVGSTHTNLSDRKSLRCPPSRRVPHKWSGRRPISTWSAQRTFRYETRRTCLSSEGGHRRLCAATSAPAEGSAPHRLRRPRHSAKNQKKPSPKARLPNVPGGTYFKCSQRYA